MPRRIDNINFVLTMVNTGLLGGDGNAPFMLLIAAIHNKRLAHFCLIIAKCFALLQ